MPKAPWSLPIFSRFLRVTPSEQLVGLNVDDAYLETATLSQRGRNVVLEILARQEIDPDVNPLDMDTSLVVRACCFPSCKTLVRACEVGLVKPKEVEAAFRFQIEPLLPYSLEKCVVDKIVLGRTEKSTRLLIFSALREDVRAALERLEALHVDPECLVPKALALFRFCDFFYQEGAVRIVVDVGMSETTVLYLGQHTSFALRSLPLGLTKLDIEALQDLNGHQGHELDAKVAGLHLFLRELSRVLLSFEMQRGGEEGSEIKTAPILFTGPIVRAPKLIALFCRFLHRETAPAADPSLKMRLPEEYRWDDVRAFAAPIGVALSQLDKHADGCANFRQEEFGFGSKWLRWKRELVVYFLLMAALSLSLFCVTSMHLESGRKELVEQYRALVALMDDPSQEPHDPDLSTSAIEDALFTIQRTLEAPHEEMALHPDVPRVSDLIAWLTGHPQIAVGEDNAPIRLESLFYTMVKRPEKGKLREHYQVRVDFEFSSDSATRARELHDALLAPNSFVDPKGELKWSTQRGHYVASFMLKDRTRYPHEEVHTP